MNIPRRPGIHQSTLEAFISDQYGLSGTLLELGSYDDQNFCLTTHSGARFICKISHVATNKVELAAQNEAMSLLSQKLPTAVFPQLIRDQNGCEITSLTQDGRSFLVRVLTFVEGSFLSEDENSPLGNTKALGRFLGQMDAILSRFEHLGTRRDHKWDLQNTLLLEASLELLENREKEQTVRHFLDRFKIEVQPRLDCLPKQVIHGDANDTNILRLPGEVASPRFGIIDFGDLTRTRRVFEVTIAAAYAMLGKSNPLAHALALVQGYHQVLPLNEDERNLLFLLTCCRLCMSIVYANQAIRKEPANPHLHLTTTSGWDLLKKLAAFDSSVASRQFLKLE